MKVNDENSRIRIQDSDPDPNPDPLVRGMDPRIRIRIHPKMSWIRNTASFIQTMRGIRIHVGNFDEDKISESARDPEIVYVSQIRNQNNHIRFDPDLTFSKKKIEK